MSISFSKYKDNLLEAWKDVVDDRTHTNWALFGYEKQSNDLMLIEKGDGGLEELIDELNSGKVMYAFCRVIDQNTSLPKFVLINWQGEGAPLSRKGSCANHVVDVSNFFKGAHVTINARTEDDVEPSLIMEKVAKSTASKFNFKERSDPVENITPVGSVYRRIQPTREIDPVEREKFWMKEQEEEKRRVDEERKRLEHEKRKLEQERKDRELKEAHARDEVINERTRSISKMREAERNAENSARNAQIEKMQWEKQQQEDAKEEKQRMARSESLRRERNQEAQALISKRTINARAIFEQNTCAGQMSAINAGRRATYPAIHPMLTEEVMRSTSVSSPTEQQTFYSLQETSPTEQEIIERESEESKLTSQIPPEHFNYTRNLLKEGLPPRQDSELENNPEEEQNWDEPTLEAPPDVKDPLTEMMAEHGINVSQQQEVKDPPQVIMANNQEKTWLDLRARALYDYQAADETEISFDPDDIISQIEQIDEGWWQGMAPDGSYGLFPANYVELLD